jgi:hypothetical protein
MLRRGTDRCGHEQISVAYSILVGVANNFPEETGHSEVENRMQHNYNHLLELRLATAFSPKLPALLLCMLKRS